MEPGYDPEDRVKAFHRALEWGERIPIGIIYRNNRSVLEERIPIIRDQSLMRQPTGVPNIENTIKEFY